MTRIAVLKGGRSLERQVSLKSAARVEDALARLGYEVVGVDVGHDLVARMRAERPDVAFVPGRAAYLDGRGGSSMRLNFSGVDDDAIREGVRRIGEVVREQVALYGTLTAAAAPAAASEPAPLPVDPDLADVLHLPRRDDRGERRAR